MVRKRDSSSVSSTKSTTPRIKFKKLNSCKKGTKKKKSSPCNKLKGIIKKTYIGKKKSDSRTEENKKDETINKPRTKEKPFEVIRKGTKNKMEPNTNSVIPKKQQKNVSVKSKEVINKGTKKKKEPITNNVSPKKQPSKVKSTKVVKNDIKIKMVTTTKNNSRKKPTKVEKLRIDNKPVKSTQVIKKNIKIKVIANPKKQAQKKPTKVEKFSKYMKQVSGTEPTPDSPVMMNRLDNSSGEQPELTDANEVDSCPEPSSPSPKPSSPQNFYASLPSQWEQYLMDDSDTDDLDSNEGLEHGDVDESKPRITSENGTDPDSLIMMNGLNNSSEEPADLIGSENRTEPDSLVMLNGLDNYSEEPADPMGRENWTDPDSLDKINGLDNCLEKLPELMGDGEVVYCESSDSNDSTTKAASNISSDEVEFVNESHQTNKKETEKIPEEVSQINSGGEGEVVFCESSDSNDSTTKAASNMSSDEVEFVNECHQTNKKETEKIPEEVSQINSSDEENVKILFTSPVSSEREYSSPRRSTIEDQKILLHNKGFKTSLTTEKVISSSTTSCLEEDLHLSTSTSESSSLSSVEGLFGLMNTKKRKKNTVQLPSKLAQKKKPDTCSDDRQHKRKLREIINPSSSSNTTVESEGCVVSSNGSISRPSPQSKSGLESPSSSKTVSSLFSLKPLKVTLIRLEEEEHGKNFPLKHLSCDQEDAKKKMLTEKTKPKRCSVFKENIDKEITKPVLSSKCSSKESISTTSIKECVVKVIKTDLQSENKEPTEKSFFNEKSDKHTTLYSNILDSSSSSNGCNLSKPRSQEEQKIYSRDKKANKPLVNEKPKTLPLSTLRTSENSFFNEKSYNHTTSCSKILNSSSSNSSCNLSKPLTQEGQKTYSRDKGANKPLVNEIPKTLPLSTSRKRSTILMKKDKITSPLKKKPKLCKKDLILRKSHPAKKTSVYEPKCLSNQANINTKIDSSATVNTSPKKSNIQTGNFIVNRSNVKPDSFANPAFKIPQVYHEKKKIPISTSKTIENVNNKPSSSKVSNVYPLTQSPGMTEQNVNLRKTPTFCPNSTTNLFTQSNYYEEDNDDNESVISMAVNPELVKYLSELAGGQGQAKNKMVPNRSNAKKNRISFENSYTRPNEAIQDTSYVKRDFNNGHVNRASGPASTMTSRGLAKPHQSLYDPIYDSDDDEKEDVDDGVAYFKRRKTVNTGSERKKKIEGKFGSPHFSDLSTTKAESSDVSNRISFNESADIPLGPYFNDYCLHFLRTSITKSQDHPCDLKHEVPSWLFQTSPDYQLQDMAQEIKYVCRQNFSNPPLNFLEGIISKFFTKTIKDKHLIEYVVTSMKENILVDCGGPERYFAIWTNFFKLLIKSIVQFHAEPDILINCFLSKVISNIDHIRNIDLEVLKFVLCELAKVVTENKNYSFRLLAAVEFLNSKGHKLPAEEYPIPFIEAVLLQVKIKAARLKGEKTIFSFLFKVYKTFFSNIVDCKRVYEFNKSLTEEFFEMAVQHNISGAETKLSILQYTNEMHINSNLRICDTRQPGVNDNRVLQQQRSVNSSSRLDEMLNGNTPKTIFDNLRTNGGINYLKILQGCEGSTKTKCNNITMSFILLEAEKSNWELCYDLFQEIIQFDPVHVKDYVKEESTPANRILVIAKCCLKSFHVHEAVCLFLQFRLFEGDHSKWLIQNSPEDIGLWEQICKDMEVALDTLSQYSEKEAECFIKIITHQNSLRAPVRLQSGLNTFFWKATETLYENCAWNAIAKIVLHIVKANLLKQLTLHRIENYRILVRAICRANIPGVEIDVPDVCARLMKKSNTFCDVYPTSWNKDCNEVTLKSCLTVDEIQAFFLFKIKVFKKMLELKSLHITFEEYINQIEDWKKPYFRAVDSTVKGVIERFKTACQKIGLNTSSLIVTQNKVIVDKVMQLELIKRADEEH